MKSIIWGIVMLMFFSCKPQADIFAEGPVTDKGQLLFFLDPYGGPCQRQDVILNELETKISSKVVIRRVATTSLQDRAHFYQYGIRALPLLILLDAKGNVVKRFSPGIQDQNTILEIIRSCDCS